MFVEIGFIIGRSRGAERIAGSFIRQGRAIIRTRLRRRLLGLNVLQHDTNAGLSPLLPVAECFAGVVKVLFGQLNLNRCGIDSNKSVNHVGSDSFFEFQFSQ